MRGARHSGPVMPTPRALRSEAPLLLAALLALATFALAAWNAVAQVGLQRLDGAGTVWAASLDARLPILAGAVALLGSNALVLPAFLLLGSVLWLRGQRVEAAVSVLLPFALQAAVHSLKLLFQLGRPDGGLVAALGYGFPSGHTANAVATGTILGWLALRRGLLTRNAALAVAATYTLAMALGRMAGGAHYLTDVVGGASLAISLCAATLAAASMAQRRAVPVAVPVPVAPASQAEPQAAEQRRLDV